MRRALEIAAFLALACLFTFTFMRNPFQAGDPYDPKQWRPRVFETFQEDTYNAIQKTIEMTRRDGCRPGGGFIYGYPKPDDVYDRAFALHVKLYGSIFSRTTMDSAAFIRQTQWVVAGLFGTMLAAFALFVRRHIGWGAAIALTVLTCLSDWLVFVARNIDLLVFLRLLPALLSFMLFRHVVADSRLKFRYFLVTIGAVMLLLCLCSNPFITNVVFGIGVGPVFWGVMYRKPVRRIAAWTLASVTVATAAVTVGVVATSIQGYLYFHDVDRALNVFHAAFNRMYGNEIRYAASDWSAPPEVSVFQIFEQYLAQPMMSLPFYQNKFPGYHIYLSFYAFVAAVVPFSLLALLDGKHFPRIEANRTLLVSLSVTTLYALAASLSWAFLMKGHMWHHLHQASLVFYIPYMLFLYMLIGCGTAITLLQLADFVRKRRLPALLTGTDLPAHAETPKATMLQPRQKTGRRK